VPRPRRRRRGEPAALQLLLAAPGRGQAISGLEIARALGTAWRPRSRRQLMSAFHAWPGLAAWRADFCAHLVATMQYLARQASWADGGADPRATARPTRRRICDEVGYCASTWKACRRVLEAAGWVRVLRQGRSQEARQMSQAEGLQYVGNDAAVYLLAIPRVKNRPARAASSASELTRPPIQDAESAMDTPRGAVDSAGQEPGRTALRAGSSPTPADVRALAAGRGLEKLTDRAVSACWRPFEAALWSADDWLWAVGHWPDGRPHAINPPVVRFPASWLRWRLEKWLDDDGRPVLSPSRQRAADRAAAHPDRDRQRAEYTARDQAAGADPGPHADELRETRGWKKGNQ
jgi:hypothetical protein